MLKNLIPPFLYCAYIESRRKYGYFGEYQNWKDAKSKCTGYDSGIIVEKVKNSALKVKNGEAAYERDSVTFDKADYFWPILGPLLWIASKNNNSLRVLDFGGALGTTYYQNRKFLKHLNLDWSIIEQPKFVEYGKKYFEERPLKFYENLQEYNEKPDIIILSSVLQYLETPYQILTKLIEIGANYILINKTPFLNQDKDVITIQKVHPKIYGASYPSWVFSLHKFLNFMADQKYNLLCDIGSQTMDIFKLGNKKVDWKGFLFEKHE